MKLRCVIGENITGYVKNRWNKHRLVCIHFDSFSMLFSNMSVIFYNSAISTKQNGRKWKVSTAVNRWSSIELNMQEYNASIAS